VDVLEVEPQTLWTQTQDPRVPYRVQAQSLERLAALPARKLVHSVGTPVGGSVRAHAAQIPLLRQTIEALGSPWASEHLSFNLTEDFFTGFLLPPRQTAAGVSVYVEAIKQLQDGLGVPIAIETAVNYLRRRSDEIPDGQFVAEVADRAECGILLDLHNVYCNDRNGRQTVWEFVSEIPLDRVWEIHLAGGFELQGFWLDAHSGAVPQPLVQIARWLVPRLPALRAIIFELFPSFLPRFGLEATRQQLQLLRDLWQTRATSTQPVPPRRAGNPVTQETSIAPGLWERALGAVVIGRPGGTQLERELADDPGAQLVGGLIKEFRGSMIVGVYRLTSRLLMLALGADVFRAILEDFWMRTPPQQFAASEGDAFADYLQARNIRVPQLEAVLEFERATVATLRDGRPRVVRFHSDPFPLLRALGEGRLPGVIGTAGEYEIEVTDEGPLRVDPVGDAPSVGVLPFH
jgi:uncharacterized protein (UPF0276 family)